MRTHRAANTLQRIVFQLNRTDRQTRQCSYASSLMSWMTSLTPHMLISEVFYERGDTAVNKDKCQCLIRLPVPVPALQSEGSHAQELTGSSSCGSTPAQHRRLTAVITSAVRHTSSCLAFTAVPPLHCLISDNICTQWQPEWINRKLLPKVKQN